MKKILYISSKGAIHDYRFLEKLVQDYEVLYLHYSANEIIDEIKNLSGLKIIAKKPLKASFPLLSELLHLRKIYRDFKPDIIHSGYVWQVGILASMLNLHPHLSMVWGSDILVEPDRFFLLKMLTRKVMRQCDHIQCDAEFVKSRIIEDYKIPPDKITVFPWGINLSLFKKLEQSGCRKELGLNNSDLVFICTRPLQKLYRVIEMLQQFKTFAEDKNDVRMLLTTDGSLKSEVLDFIKINKLEDKVLFKGWIEYSKLPIYFNAADVYVSYSLSDGSSLALLEAMACGLGLIVSDVPAIKEWVSEENGQIVKREDPNQLLDAFNNYYTNRTLIQSHSEKNIQIAKERADWDKNYIELKKIYQNLLQTR